MNPGEDDILEISVRQLIDLRAEETPDAVFLVDPADGATVTYGELKSKVQTVASRIAGHGVKPGERVGFAFENGVLSAVSILGIYYGGFVATSVNLVAGADIIAYVLDHSEAKLVLAQDKTLELVKEASEQLESGPDIAEVTSDFINQTDTVFDLQCPRNSDDGLLMYTSGTTGRPKGVVHTHKSLLAGGLNATLAHKLTAADRAMCVLPLYHINGMCVTLMGPLVSGSSVIMPGRFSVREFWPTVVDHSATWFSVVPTHISYLLHDAGGGVGKTGKLRFGRSASAPLPMDVHKAFEERFGVPIIETMGLTETAAQILSNPLPPGVRKIGSPGVAIGNEVMVADDRQVEVKRGVEGEVLVRGPNVMRVYLKNPEATAETLTEDSWLRTGDLGRMDEDGYVFITGRLKELIIKGGENIAPREIDEALYSHPSIKEAAAFSCPCDRYGERVEAAVVLGPEGDVSEDELLKLCISKIGTFKAPDRVHFMDELPKGPSGKIQRKKLQEILHG